MTTTKLLRSRMNRNDSRPVLKTSGAGDSLAEFNYTAPVVVGGRVARLSVCSHTLDCGA
jgi:hypothetical protein